MSRKAQERYGDLVAAGATYHHACRGQFHEGRSREKKAQGRPHVYINSDKCNDLLKLCTHIDNNDRYQFSVTDLVTVMKTFLTEGSEGFTTKHMKLNPIDHFRDTLIV